MPAVAFGVVIDANLLAAFFGGLSVLLVWELLGRLGSERRARVGLTVGWALGSQVFWVATEGGQTGRTPSSGLRAFETAPTVRVCRPWSLKRD